MTTAALALAICSLGVVILVAIRVESRSRATHSTTSSPPDPMVPASLLREALQGQARAMEQGQVLGREMISEVSSTISRLVSPLPASPSPATGEPQRIPEWEMVRSPAEMREQGPEWMEGSLPIGWTAGPVSPASELRRNGPLPPPPPPEMTGMGMGPDSDPDYPAPSLRYP